MIQNRPPDFDSIKHMTEQGVEYWSARELMPLLGYKNWREFDNAISKAKAACEQTGNLTDDHFGDVLKMIEVGKGARRKVKDYVLSRFACYLVSENGDPRKPEIATAQVYFAIAARQQELQQLENQVTARVELRKRVAEGEQELEQDAQRSGVLPANFGRFHGAGYQGLYGGLTVAEVKERKGVGQTENLLDRVGLGELGAHALRVALTQDKLRREATILNEIEATEAHREVGEAVRGAYESAGATMPENLPAEPSIQPLLSENHKKQSPKLPPPANHTVD